MKPLDLPTLQAGDRLLDLNTSRVLTVMHVHPYADMDAVVFAAANPDSFDVLLYDDPIPKGKHLVREYSGTNFRAKVVTNDRDAVHIRNVEIISAIDAILHPKHNEGE